MLCFVIINSILFNLKCFDHIYIDQENHHVFLSCPIQTLRVHYIHTSILCTTQKNMYNVHTHKKRTKKDSLNLTNKHCNAIGLSTWGPSWTLHHVQQMLFKTLEALWANIKNVRFFFLLLHMLFNAKSKTCKFYYVMRPTSRSLLLLILNWHWELNRQKSVDKGMFTRGKKNIHLSLPFPDRQLGCHSAWCVCKFNMCSPCPLPQYHDIFRHTLHRCCTAQFFGICSTCLHTASHSTPVNSHPLIFEAAWRTAK